MAEKAWSQINTNNKGGNTLVFESLLDATDSDTQYLGLNPRKEMSIGVKTTGSALVDVYVYMEDPANVGAVSFKFAHQAGTVNNVDFLKSSLGPLFAVKCLGTISGTETATIQVIQTEAR